MDCRVKFGNDDAGCAICLLVQPVTQASGISVGGVTMTEQGIAESSRTDTAILLAWR